MMREQMQHNDVSVLELFTHSGCISGQEGVRWIQDVLREFPEIAFREMDMLNHTDRARVAGAKFSPTLVLDGEILFVGMPHREELVALLRRKLKGIPHA